MICLVPSDPLIVVLLVELAVASMENNVDLMAQWFVDHPHDDISVDWVVIAVLGQNYGNDGVIKLLQEKGRIQVGLIGCRLCSTAMLTNISLPPF